MQVIWLKEKYQSLKLHILLPYTTMGIVINEINMETILLFTFTYIWEQPCILCIRGTGGWFQRWLQVSQETT